MKVEGLRGIKLWGTSPSPKKSLEKDFKDFLVEKIQEVDQKQKTALKTLEGFATGQKEDLLELTLALSQADLSFKYLLRVRNKIVEAYQEIMRMQI